MTENLYDNEQFFQGYSQLNRSVYGLNGAPEWPSIVRMLPNMENIDVLDLGCGYGWFSRYARLKGANKVLALDISQRMLTKAQEMTSDNEITYCREDLEEVKLEKEIFHLAYSSLTLHYIKDLSGLLNKIYHSLKPGGYFVFSVEHPIYTSPKNPQWIIDNEGQKSWPIDNYQKEGCRITNWFVQGVVKQHRMIGTYLNMLIEQGFLLKHVEEWGPSSEQIIANPSLDEEKERPMILLVSAQKPIGT